LQKSRKGKSQGKKKKLIFAEKAGFGNRARKQVWEGRSSNEGLTLSAAPLGEGKDAENIFEPPL